MGSNDGDFEQFRGRGSRSGDGRGRREGNCTISRRDGLKRAKPTRSSNHIEGSGLTPPLLELGASNPSPADPQVTAYLSRLPQCGAMVAFRLCPSAFKLLCALAGAMDRSGDPLGEIGETAGLQSPTTRAGAVEMLTALGLVDVERVRGPGGEVRGSRWRLLEPPARMRDEARALVEKLIAQRIERDRRIQDELPEQEGD